MKRFLIILLAVSMLLGLSSCSTDDLREETERPEVSSEIPEQSEITTEAEAETLLQPCEQHQHQLAEILAEMPLRDRVEVHVCPRCGERYEEVVPNTATKTLKVLALGNSFSQDAMQYLWNICKDGGVETVVLANLYIGGASLAKHWDNISGSKGAYTYYKNTSGSWEKNEETSVDTALLDEDWDVITVQQSSGYSGNADSYFCLSRILNYFEENKTNPNAKILWHLTWAYQGDSSHSDFYYYDNDQTTMYNCILEALEQEVKPKEAIEGVIPAGTAIQNLRSSYIGDAVTRDGYHMSHDYGRYTVALTWYAYLTGGELTAVDWIPSGYPQITTAMSVIWESVTNALEHPYGVTPSQYTETPTA